jgi:hypothetical protein
MKIRRDISSIPHRSARDTWKQIIDLITGPGSGDVQQLTDAAGVMASLITDEHPAECAIMLEGVGPQLRIYCRYGIKAVEEGSDVDRLTWNPTKGDWTMHVPCDAENIDWVKASLTKTSPRIKVFDIDEADRADETQAKTVAHGGKDLLVDWNFGG